MQNNAFTALSSDLNLPANFDQFLKGTAAKLKAWPTNKIKFDGIIHLWFFVSFFFDARDSEQIVATPNWRSPKVAFEKLCLVGYLDTTKFGVLSQSDINKVGQWCEKVMAKNPTGGFGKQNDQPLSPIWLTESLRQLRRPDAAAPHIHFIRWRSQSGCPETGLRNK